MAHSPEYRKHLKSDYWAKLRWKALRRAKHRCERCSGRSRMLHIHHLHYLNFGNETLDDVQVLCDICHSETHGHRLPKDVRKKAHWERTNGQRRAKAERVARAMDNWKQAALNPAILNQDEPCPFDPD